MLGRYNIKSRCLRLVLIIASMMRVRHYRGHGVHSPFVFSLVRHVFMKKRIRSSKTDTYDFVRSAGVRKHWAVQLQNLSDHCTHHSIEYILPDQNEIKIPDHDNTIICILSPHLSRARYRSCRAAIASHNGTTIDNRGYILLINDSALPKQHFKL